jgi:hypothetical protein
MSKKLAFLTLALAAVFAGSAFAQCSLPEEMINTVTIPDGDLEVHLGSTHSIVQPGDVVDFELMIVNKGNEAVTIWWPVSGPSTLMIYPPSVTDPFNPGMMAVYYFPPVLFYIPGEFTLQPGECQIYTFTWDTSTHPAAEGVYNAWSGLVRYPVEFEPREWITPAGGAVLSLTMTGEVDTENASLGGVKSQFR